MNLPKLFMFVALVLFGLIGLTAVVKKIYTDSPPSAEVPVEIVLHEKKTILQPAAEPILVEAAVPLSPAKENTSNKIPLPDADRIEELFNKNGNILPIVETITYKSHVPWQKGRPAWLTDYASHYKTSRHFIARSLNGCPDYFKQDLSEGGRFNVLRKDKNFTFHLVVDTSRCRMWFYYIDLDAKETVLLKTYPVGLGRLDSSKTSGLLTPLGKYSLGERIMIIKPGRTGIHKGKKVELITVFGTRWIPFDKPIDEDTPPVKEYGIHGVPWIHEGVNDEVVENSSSIGKYESDGCIRLATADMEELFAIIISRPTTIEIVHDFLDRR